MSSMQGLTLVHYSLNISAFCGVGGAFSGCLGGVRGCQGWHGVFGVCFVIDTAQVELRRGCVYAPASMLLLAHTFTTSSL